MVINWGRRVVDPAPFFTSQNGMVNLHPLLQEWRCPQGWGAKIL